ncbi:MAG: hypothetical protein ABI967_05710 [bacterium]
MRQRTGSIIRNWIASAFLLLICAWTGSVQAQCNGNDVVTSSGFLVRDVKVVTLFGSAPEALKAALAKHRGDKYNTTSEEDLVSGGSINGNTTRNQYIAEVKDFFSEGETVVNQDRRAGINQQDAFYVRATYISDCVTKVPESECLMTIKDNEGRPSAKCLDIKIKIKVVPIHTNNLSANLLDLARSNKLRFYRDLPKGLRTFDPAFWIDYDRDYGATAVINSTVDLLELVAPQNESNPARNTQLRLSVDGRKSLQERFYDTTSVLTLARTQPLNVLGSFGLTTGFSANEEPQGEGRRLTNAFRIGGSAVINLPHGPFTKFSLGMNYRRSSNRLYSVAGGLAEHSRENAYESRALLDGKVARGFLRGAVWFDGASQKTVDPGSYKRLAGMIGYAKEIVLQRSKCRIVTTDGQESCEFPTTNAPALGVEMLFGAGHSWGHVPQYARFFGGNSAANFLYDAVNEAAPIAMPNGPLIRSFGRNRAGVRGASNRSLGGTGYWHYNLSVAIPLRKFSRPLIPAELVNSIPDDSGHLSCRGCTSLKEALKNQVSGEKNIFIDAMAVRRMTAEQREDLALDADDPDNPLTPDQRARLDAADKVFERERQTVQPEADRVWQRLTPTIEYIADHANLYAVRPLIMFDAARSTAREDTEQRTRLALGAGIQFNVVVAKFEVGYVRTVRRLPGDERGNFTIRMLFEKLF